MNCDDMHNRVMLRKTVFTVVDFTVVAMLLVFLVELAVSVSWSIPWLLHWSVLPSVGPSFGPSVGWSVCLSVRPSHFLIPSDFCITAPTQPSETGLPCIQPCFL